MTHREKLFREVGQLMARLQNHYDKTLDVMMQLMVTIDGAKGTWLDMGIKSREDFKAFLQGLAAQYEMDLEARGPNQNYETFWVRKPEKDLPEWMRNCSTPDPRDPDFDPMG